MNMNGKENVTMNERGSETPHQPSAHAFPFHSPLPNVPPQSQPQPQMQPQTLPLALHHALTKKHHMQGLNGPRMVCKWMQMMHKQMQMMRKWMWMVHMGMALTTDEHGC